MGRSERDCSDRLLGLVQRLLLEERGCGEGYFGFCEELYVRSVLEISYLGMCVLCAVTPCESMAYPTSLEAILRAEKAFLAELQACRTLQSASIILTIKANATTLRGYVTSHTGSCSRKCMTSKELRNQSRN